MRTLAIIKKNAMALVALAIAAASYGLMSFGTTASTQWYEASYDATEGKHRIGNLIGPSLPAGDCQTALEKEFTCAVNYDGDGSVEFVEDIPGAYDVATSDTEPAN